MTEIFNPMTLRYEVENGIAIVTLNRPDKLNAFTNGMRDELISVFDQIDNDDTVRAVIVTGEGRAFCAGADLSEGVNAFQTPEVVGIIEDSDGSVDYTSEAARDSGGLVTLRIFKCLKPVIAAINGPAVGVGITMTLPMDIRIAADTARFGFVFARRGMVPEAASSWFLPRLVGISQSLQWCYSGRVFSADEALAGGLVSSLHTPEDLLPAALRIAHEMVENSAPVSIALTRQMLWRGLGLTDPMEAHRIDSRGILSRGRSGDMAEGVQAFLEKRPAVFPQRVARDMPDYFPWWDELSYTESAR